jgi:hypothetical protein
MENLSENQNLPKGTLNVQNKKIPSVTVIAVLIVFTLLIVEAYWLVEQKNKNSSFITPLFQKSSNIKPVPYNVWPGAMPYGLFLEPEAKILQLYTTNKNSEEQITLQYRSERTIAENFTLFKDYLKKNKWEIVNIVNRKEFTSISAKKPGRFLSISINSNQEKWSVVDITMITYGLTSAPTSTSTPR